MEYRSDAMSTFTVIVLFLSLVFLGSSLVFIEQHPELSAAADTLLSVITGKPLPKNITNTPASPAPTMAAEPAPSATPSAVRPHYSVGVRSGDDESE